MKNFLYITLVLLLTACGNAVTSDDAIIETTMAIDIEVTTETETIVVKATTEAPTTSVPETTIAESTEAEATTKVPEITVATTDAETSTPSPETTAPDTTTQETTIAPTTKAPMTTIAETTTAVNDGTREFTKKELQTFTGLDGTPAYIAYKGRVYDVSHIGDWAGGEHNGNYAGHDLTDDLAYAPHGEEKLKKAEIVGVLID